MTNISIRKAVLEDMPAVHGLVLELAIFEKEPEALKVGVQEYYDAFSEKLIDCILAEADGKIIGITVFYMTFSTWRGKCVYLEDFYVQPDYRKGGVGQKLFDAFLQEARDRGANMTKWQVLDWNDIALNFYDKNHATIERNWWNAKIFFTKD